MIYKGMYSPGKWFPFHKWSYTSKRLKKNIFIGYADKKGVKLYANNCRN